VDQQVERAIDHIGRSGAARTPELATLLNISPAAVEALLAKPRADVRGVDWRNRAA